MNHFSRVRLLLEESLVAVDDIDAAKQPFPQKLVHLKNYIDCLSQDLKMQAEQMQSTLDDLKEMMSKEEAND